ncbi:unnamed protein product, partial [Rotaria sp. Silwood1]
MVTTKMAEQAGEALIK